MGLEQNVGKLGKYLPLESSEVSGSQLVVVCEDRPEVITMWRDALEVPGLKVVAPDLFEGKFEDFYCSLSELDASKVSVIILDQQEDDGGTVQELVDRVSQENSKVLVYESSASPQENRLNQSRTVIQRIGQFELLIKVLKKSPDNVMAKLTMLEKMAENPDLLLGQAAQISIIHTEGQEGEVYYPNLNTVERMLRQSETLTEVTKFLDINHVTFVSLLRKIKSDEEKSEFLHLTSSCGYYLKTGDDTYSEIPGRLAKIVEKYRKG